MEMIMTNGFAELSANEMIDLTGGWSWDIVLGGAGLFVGILAAAAALTTPYGWAGIAYCAMSGLSGVAMGYGATH